MFSTLTFHVYFKLTSVIKSDIKEERKIIQLNVFDMSTTITNNSKFSTKHLMDTIKIFRRLKNGKGIETVYKKSDDRVYTIRLDYKKDNFILHSYYFDGNDVFDETNYKDESLTTYFDFNDFIRTVEANFPGIEVALE